MKLLHHITRHNEETTKPNEVTRTHNEEASQHNVVTTTHNDETALNNGKQPHKKWRCAKPLKFFFSGRVTLARGKTFLHINDLKRLPGTLLSVASVA